MTRMKRGMKRTIKNEEEWRVFEQRMERTMFAPVGGWKEL